MSDRPIPALRVTSTAACGISPHMAPSVAIIIPTKDRPEFLRRAVASAIAAIPEDGEIIVVDNGDISAVETLKGMNGPLTVLRVTRAGVSAARNEGLQASKGEVIFFLDDDDELLPHYCHEVLEVAARDAADYGHAACLRVRLDGDEVTELRPLTRRLSNGQIPTDAPFANQTFGFGTGLWITRSGFERVGDLNENLPMNEDTEYHCRVLIAGLRGWYSSKPGVRLYLHQKQAAGTMEQSASRHSAATRAECFRRIWELHGDKLREVPGAHRFVSDRVVKHLGKAKHIGDAARFIKTQSWPNQFRLSLILFMHGLR